MALPLSEGGYAKSFRELMEETDWDKYGSGRHPKCEQCMASPGYEPTAVDQMLASFVKLLVSCPT